MYPNDPYDVSTYEPWGLGQLTNKGKMREYKIGVMLRDKYNEFLGPLYRHTDVYAVSSDVDRTKMSLQLVLAGLYPPSTLQLWNPNLPWLAIPIHYAPENVDILFRTTYCPLYDAALDDVRALPEVQEKLKEHAEFLDYLREKTGATITSTNAVYEIYNLLVAQKNMNLTMPEWCTDKVFDTMVDIVIFEYDLRSWNKTLKQFSGGTMIRQFLDNLRAKDNPRKIYLYSGHEVNIAGFMRSHNIAEPKIPFYGSAVIMEKLRDEQDNVFVKLLLWTGVSEKLITLKLDGCSEVCPLEKYEELMKDVIPSDEQMNCLWDHLSRETMLKLFTERISYN